MGELCWTLFRYHSKESIYWLLTGNFVFSVPLVANKYPRAKVQLQLGGPIHSTSLSIHKLGANRPFSHPLSSFPEWGFRMLRYDSSFFPTCITEQSILICVILYWDFFKGKINSDWCLCIIMCIHVNGTYSNGICLIWLWHFFECILTSQTWNSSFPLIKVIIFLINLFKDVKLKDPHFLHIKVLLKAFCGSGWNDCMSTNLPIE